MHALRQSNVSVNAVSSNLVYDHPNIASLGQYISAVANAGSEGTVSSERKGEDVLAFLDRFTKDFPPHVPSVPASDKDVVLLTGSTGALGSALLATLVATDSVERIYAYNRPSRQGASTLERQQEALKSRGYDPKIASSPKVVMLEAELTGAGLNLDPAVEDKVRVFSYHARQVAYLNLQIRRTVTHIIHNGWRIPFCRIFFFTN